MARAADLILTAEQFDQLRELIYRALGLAFEAGKEFFLAKRVERRMAALALDAASDYVFHLRCCDPDGAEMQELANLITTNETYMFREYEQLAAFSDFCLPDVMARKVKAGDRRLRIWSAGCATGDEPYTLAIILRECISDLTAWQPQIVATDIDQHVLATARRGVYGERGVRLVPQEYVGRHIIDEGGGSYQIHPDTKRLVEFQHLNLHARDEMRGMRRFDFIFCRNVLIYFDDVSRRAVVDHFYNALNPGGYLFLGHSESVGRISTAFTLVNGGGLLSYRKA
jgi:chemotaxis protein methyltransferase CheR